MRFPEREELQMAPIYWWAQAAFVVSLPLIRLAALPWDLALLGLAAFQFALVSWGLWLGRSWPWLALAPPFSTAALWFGLGPWAASEVGGDGRGLLVGMATVAWCLISYIGVGIWAGSQQAGARTR
jgi:hypothetical protein